MKSYLMEHTQEKQSSGVSNKMLSPKNSLKTISVAKPYTCEVCHKQFSQKKSLNRHSILHTNKKPYSCDLCNKSFYLQFDLNEHHKTHKKEKSFSCEICNEKFSKIRNLKKHSLVHANESFLASLEHNQSSKSTQPELKEKKFKKRKRKKYRIDSAVTSKKSKKKSSQTLQDSFIQGKFLIHDHVSGVVDSSGVIEGCYNALSDMCKHAAQFKTHSHRDNLTVLDFQRAGGSKLNDSCTVNDSIDLKTHIGQANKCIEKEKTFYHSKCLHNLNFDPLKTHMPNQNLMDYFNLIMQSVVKDNTDLFFYSLADLKRNPYILPLLPFFMQSICKDIILLEYTPIKLQKLLKILHSLHQNTNLYFGNKNLYTLIDFTTSCITSNLIFSSFALEDYSGFQKRAAEILRDTLTKDCIQFRSVYTHALSKLEAPFNSSKQRFLSCYGTINAVNIIGLPAILHILQLLFHNSSEKLYVLWDKWEEKETNMFHEKVFEACESLLKYYLKDVNLHETCVSKDVQILHCEEVPLNTELCNNILDFYGDSLYSRFSFLESSSDRRSLKDFFSKCNAQKLLS